jgi:hypothetical protein
LADKLFTLEQALELLPVVRQLLIEIQAKKREVDEASETLDGLLALSSGNGHLLTDVAKARQAVEDTATELRTLMSELDETGAELKGIEDGLIDFPSEREGRVVYLCWRMGEDTISFWHELDAGFPGRQPL